MSSNKHGEYRRPEIVRANDLLAQDQRKIIERQTKRIEAQEKKSRNELFGFINSKIYANLENSINVCFNLCRNSNSQEEGVRLPYIKTQLDFTKEINNSCFKNCVSKKYESFDMLLNVYLINFSIFLRK
jgi:hypothetical protein